MKSSPSVTVALLRGINNVGSRRVTMAALQSAFEALGFTNVRTVLASGNVIFEAPRTGPGQGWTIALGLEKALGFPVTVLLRTARELRAIVRSDPFTALQPVPEVQRYVTFLDGKETVRRRGRLPAPPKGIKIVRVDPREIFSIVDLAGGGTTPELMRYLDRNLGPEGTTRNWRTVLKLAAGER